MKKLVSLSALVIAVLVSLGLLSQQTASAQDNLGKREDDIAEVTLVADDDDDDTNDNTDGDTDTGVSRETGDNTNSRYTAVSRNRDLSRGDKTRDWTRDGGKKQRDFSANRTNDKSRNDTRR